MLILSVYTSRWVLWA